MTYSEDFLNLLEKYFFKLRDDILHHVKNKIFSINVYYFNHEYYNKTFYFNEQSNNEILKIIDNINNFYNELNIDANIKIKAVNLAQEILQPYHNKKIKELDKFYDRLYDRTTDWHIKSDEKDFCYSYWRYLFFGWKNKYLYTKHHNNINKVLKDLKITDEYLLNETNIIFRNFTTKIDKYLNRYVKYCQNLYSHLKHYVENKINNSSTKNLMENYFNVYNNMVVNSSNEGLLSKMDNKLKLIKDNIDTCINKFSSNIKLLNEQYYNLFYLPNYTSFLEYPEEIIYKINQYYEEALFNIDNIKMKVNYIYQKRINYIIKSTNIYINSFLKNNINYIKSNVNSSYIIDQYYLSKFIELDNLYNSCYVKNNIININKIIFLNKQSYDDKMKINLDYINDFILFLENITNATFIYDKCNNTNDTIGSFYNETICHKEKKAFNLSYIKYNYDIIKIRTGIYYTRTLIENIDTLFDEYNFHDIINTNKIKIYDQLLNDKNIIDVYNKTNYKIKEINKESDIFINESYEYFLEDFKSKYSFKNDYLPFVEEMKNIIKLKDYNYTIAINNILNETSYSINSLMNEFNQTLFSQISLRENYTFYNYDQEYFKNIYYTLKSNIKKMFNKNRENITNLNNNYIFHNGIKTILSKLQIIKRKYIRDTINNFSKNYDFELLNISYNLGEKIEKHLEKEYNDYEFTFIYNYIEIFENFTQDYIHKIIKYINSTEKETLETFENIYDIFYNELKSNPTSFINPNFIKKLKYNQTRCEYYINYSKPEYFENDSNIYNNISNNIHYIFSNCLNLNNNIKNDINNNTNYTINNNYTLNNNYNLYENYSLNEKINYILNISNNCSDFFFDLKNSTYYNDTLNMMDCYNNNYYIINYTFIYFYNFSDEIEANLYNISDKMNKIIIKNRIDENFFYNFLQYQNYTLESYENIDLLDISYNFEDIESMINYINIIKNDKYKNYLYDILITSFNISYINFIENFILDELMDDIIISINNRLEIHLDYMTKKINDEYKYYLLILNTTNELGYSSKMALINLYEKIKIKLNETIFYLFEEDINFYLDLFFRENKIMFRNNFLNYYINNINGYNTTIYKLEKFSDELILDSSFNKTLDNISKYLMNNKIIKQIKEKINNSINTKIQNLFNLSDISKINIEKILNKKTTRPLPPDMNHTNELIINYTNLINNQKNRFYLNISDEPFNILTEFIEGNLEPPLNLIKEQYRTIEERLLNETFAIIDRFPNYYLTVKEKLDLEMMNENITPYINYANETIYDYIEILDKDIKSYINKLIHYTYISGLYYIDSPCNDSYCFNESEILDTDIDIFNTTDYNKNSINIRRLEQIEKKKFIGLFNYTKLDKEKTKKLRNKNLRKLEEYDSSKGSITENDINSYIVDMQDILYDFTQSYLNREFRDINRFSKVFFDKINNTYLFKLHRSFEMTSIKFNTIFTEEMNKIFEDRLFEQYNNISLYINNHSKIIEKTKNEFINSLNDSSILINMISEIFYMKINTYYKQIYQLIQDKTKYIDEGDDINSDILRMLSKKDKDKEDDDEENPADVKLPDKIKKNEAGKKITIVMIGKKVISFFKDLFKNTKEESLKAINAGEAILNSVKKESMKYHIPVERKESILTKLSQRIESVFINPEIDASIGGQCTTKQCNLMINFCITLFKLNFDNLFVFPIPLIPSFLDLVVSIIPKIESEICLGFGPNIDIENVSKSTFDIDISGGASVSVTINLGLVVPSAESPIRFSFNVGLVGVLGSGKAGVKLSLYYKDQFSIDCYYEFKAFELSFYVMLTLTIELKIIKLKFEFSFYIIQKTLGGFKHEYHKIYFYKYKHTKFIDYIKEKSYEKGYHGSIEP